MWFFIALIVLILVCVIAGYYFYKFVFYIPIDKRFTPDSYRNHKFFNPYKSFLIPKLDAIIEEPYEQIYITSEDGLKLAAKYYHNSDSAPYVIFLNGYKGHAYGDFAAHFYLIKSLGYNILLTDQRACGLSEGDCATFGIKERYDCVAWADYLTSRFGDDIRICLFGISMGAATVMMALDLNPPETVKCIIEDCGYTSPKEVLCYNAEIMNIPKHLGYFLTSVGARIYGKFNLNESTAIDAISKSKLPILYIHGTADDFVPFWMLDKLYQAGGGPKAKLAVKDAGHAVSYPQNPDEYEKSVKAFLAEYL